MNATWDPRYLRLAREVASWSKDPNKKCGAVVIKNQKVQGIGFNGFPRGVNDSAERLNSKSTKLKIIVHAEVNAIVASECKGDTIYVWPQLPCSQCMGLIIQAGIKRVVSHDASSATSWDQEIVYQIAQEAKVKVDMFKLPI